MNMSLPAEIEKGKEYFNAALSLLESAAGMYFFLWDTQNGAYFVSPALLEKYNLPESNVFEEKASFEKIIYPPDHTLFANSFSDLKKRKTEEFELDLRLIEPLGGRAWLNMRCWVVQGKGNTPPMLAGRLSEIDHAHRADKETGLLNREQFFADFGEEAKPGSSGVIVVFGIDDFKAVNERHGHKFGNRLLKLLAYTLERRVTAVGRVYRLDGDRFAAHLPERDEVTVNKLYEAVKKDFAAGCQALREDVFSTVSAGAVRYPADAVHVMELFQFSESALNTAKRSGKNSLVFFSREAYDQYLIDISVREDLQRCVKNDYEGFALHYQPQISMKTGKVGGAEALLRWTSKEHGSVPPDIFIPLLEQTGLICQVGRWVLEQALDQCRLWRTSVPDFCMSVNLSYIQLEKDDIAGFLLGYMRRHRLPGNAVLLELTESAQLHNYHYYNETLSYLNRIGVMVAIDDFGTGYSSLGYFKELNINQIKIDRCFVTRVRESEYDYKLIQFITELAHGIGVVVCVEGVETEEEFKALVPLQPDLMQGFFFGYPVPPAEFEERFVNGWDKIGKELWEQSQQIAQGLAQDSGWQPAVRESAFEALLDELGECVHVSGYDDYEILYMNRALRFASGLQVYGGRKCYEVFYGREVPCDVCERNLLTANEFCDFKASSLLLEAKSLVRVKQVDWHGKKARLGMTVDFKRNKKSGQKAKWK